MKIKLKNLTIEELKELRRRTEKRIEETDLIIDEMELQEDLQKVLKYLGDFQKMEEVQKRIDFLRDCIFDE